MELYFSKKNKIKLVALSSLLACPYSFASTSLMVSGHAGLVGQYLSNTPPLNSSYFALRAPIGLTLEASPSDNLNIFLGFDYAYNNYPAPSVLLGQTSTTSASNSNGQSTPMPFANTVNASNGAGGTPYAQKTDTPTLTSAYFSYQTPVGLFKAGRMPRHWGLGVWYNDEWSPTSGPISTSDAVVLATDLNLFDVSVYYERLGESVGGSSTNETAAAYTLEARLKTDAADIPSSGVNREIGILYSKFDHGQSNTSLNILDTYGKFYISKFFIGGEILYPNGKTQNPNYQTLGGAAECTVTTGDTTQSAYQSCNSQSFSALAALLRLKLQLDGSENSSLFATETSQKLLGTAERQESSVLGLWLGYASGGGNQFANADNSINGTQSGNNISAIMMNSSIQPAFLMFNNTTPSINGMPTGAITNTIFARFDYTYETPGMGAIGPILTWGRLNRINPNYKADNTNCTNTNGTSRTPTVNSTIPINRVCVGGNNNLGVELDLTYRYTTMDRVNIGFDVGYWMVGDAWKVYGQASPTGAYGMRIFTGTQF